MNNPKTGDLVYIIDPNGKEPIMMGHGLVVGETRSYGSDYNKEYGILCINIHNLYDTYDIVKKT